MEALLLAGGKAERLGDAAQGHPKPLVPVAGYPLAEYTVARLVAAGVTRVIVACRAGQEDVFVNALAGLGAEIEPVGEAEPLGRFASPATGRLAVAAVVVVALQMAVVAQS